MTIREYIVGREHVQLEFADSINAYWRKRGYDAQCEVFKKEPYRTKLMNGDGFVEEVRLPRSWALRSEFDAQGWPVKGAE